MPPMSFTGVVTKVGVMNKTATVTISRMAFHPRTGKRLERNKKILTHDEHNQLRFGDSVVIRNCPPVSARKRFTLEKILRSPEHEQTSVEPGTAPVTEARESAEPTPSLASVEPSAETRSKVEASS